MTTKDLAGDCPITKIEGRGWFPARPVNYKHRTLRERFKEAWMVFRGKADPFVWPEDEIKSGSAKPERCFTDIVRHLHDEAEKIEEEALPMMKDGRLHGGYQRLELSASLRTTANYLDGVSAS